MLASPQVGVAEERKVALLHRVIKSQLGNQAPDPVVALVTATKEMKVGKREIRVAGSTMEVKVGHREIRAVDAKTATEQKEWKAYWAGRRLETYRFCCDFASYIKPSQKDIQTYHTLFRFFYSNKSHA